jgi:zinc transport system ATP-binding protein
MAVLSVKNLHVTLNEHHILDDVSFEVEKGQIAAVIGPNGSGKTTLLKAILGLIPYSGAISILGADPAAIQKISGKIGYVPQRLEFDRTMPVTVEELLSIHASKKNIGRIHEALSLAHAEQLLKKPVRILSGGEFQRVLLTLALLNDPEVLFLDEPVASIDIEGSSEIYALLQELKDKKKLTIILVSHDVDIVFHYATTVLCINHQLLCRGVPHEALTPETLKKLYGGQHALYAHKEKRHKHHHA